MTAPAIDLSPAARADRQRAHLRAIRAARRDTWRRSGGDPDAYRRIMADWLRQRRSRP